MNVKRGPWSNQAEIYRPPESNGPQPFFYGAIAHPELKGLEPCDLIVTYATNSFEFANLFTEYGKKPFCWPRVIAVRVGNQRSNRMPPAGR